MSDGAGIVAALLGQVIGALAVVSGLVFWRGTSFLETASALGRIHRAKVIIPLTPRLKRLEGFYLFRTSLFTSLIICLASTLVCFFHTLNCHASIVALKTPDPGILDMLVTDSQRMATFCVWLSFSATVVIFIEWLTDAICRYNDLEASLLVIHLDGGMERPESPMLQLDYLSDNVLLWQLRLHLLTKRSDSQNLSSFEATLGDSTVNWGEFSKAVCAFRSFAIHHARPPDASNSITEIAGQSPKQIENIIGNREAPKPG
jgi:hypothetical protein